MEKQIPSTQSGLDLSAVVDNIARMDRKVTRKSRIRPNSDGRREQIVNAALNVMIAEGVYHATTRKIAEAAGVNVATLHYHFHNKEEIILSVMEVLASSYRNTLAKRFSGTQPIRERIPDLLRFIWTEIEKARGEQLVLQEMTLYVLRLPGAEHLAAEKEREIMSLYFEALRACSDVGPDDDPKVTVLTNFLYTSFVGILNQWLATNNSTLLQQTTDNLILSAQHLSDNLNLGTESG